MNEARPEWICCIDSPVMGKPLCRRDAALEWRFTGLDHVYATVVCGGRQAPCLECVAIAVAVLQEGAANANPS